MQSLLRNSKVGDARRLAMHSVRTWMHAGIHLRMIGRGREEFQVRMFEFCDRVSAASSVGTQVKVNCD